MLAALFYSSTHFYLRRPACFYMRAHSSKIVQPLPSPAPNMPHTLPKCSLYWLSWSLISAICAWHLFNSCCLCCISLVSCSVYILILVCSRRSLAASEMCYFYICYLEVEDCRQLICVSMPGLFHYDIIDINRWGYNGVCWINIDFNINIYIAKWPYSWLDIIVGQSCQI